jgi:hypothetical protein
MMSKLRLLALALIGVSAVASAAPVLLGSTTDPTGIDGLLVDGTTYNVTFSTTTLNPLFSFGVSPSADAAAALAGALNTLNVASLNGEPFESSSYQILLDDALSPSFSDFVECATISSATCALPWKAEIVLDTTGLGQIAAVGAAGSYFTVAADFVVASTSTPEPATLSLFILGLAGIGLMSRRRWT